MKKLILIILPTLIYNTLLDQLYTCNKNSVCQAAAKSQETVQKLLSDFSHQEQSIKPLEVHFTLHSHLDVYWLQSYEQYMEGTGSDKQHAFACTDCIYTNVIESLLLYPKSTYIVAEIAFFKPWYKKQSKSDQEKIKELIKEGRLDIANGGWVQNDQACSNYQDIILQMATGHQFIYREFGHIPEVAFNIDAFGHSVAQSAINYLSGFKGQLLERIDTMDIMERTKNHALEFIWLSGPASINFLKKDEVPNLLTHVRFRRHSSFRFHQRNFAQLRQDGDGFCLQIFTTLKDFEKLMLSQAAGTKRIQFLNIQGSVGKDFVFHYGGDDFQLFNASHYEAQNLIVEFYSYFDCRSIKMIWSTPTRYFRGLKEKINSNDLIQQHYEMKNKSGDFFPYWEDGLYWTGFYTTYPAFKLFVRQSALYMQSMHFYVSQFLICAGDREDLFTRNFISKTIYELQLLREEVSLAQHHDGITGTSKYWVHDDVQKRLRLAIEQCRKNIEVISQILYIKSRISMDEILTGQKYARQSFRSSLEMINVLECSHVSEAKNTCIQGLLQLRRMRRRNSEETEYPEDIILMVLNPQHTQMRLIELELPEGLSNTLIYSLDGQLLENQEIRCLDIKHCKISFLVLLRGYSEERFVMKFYGANQNVIYNNWEAIEDMDYRESIRQMEENFEKGEAIDETIQQNSKVIYSSDNFNLIIDTQKEGMDYQFTFKIEALNYSSTFVLSYLFYPNIRQQSWNQWNKRGFLGQAGKYIMMNDPNSKGLVCQFDQFQKLEQYSKISLDIKMNCGKVYDVIVRIYPWDLESGFDIETIMNSNNLPTQQGDFTLQVYAPYLDEKSTSGSIYVDSNGWFPIHKKNYEREDYKPVYNETDQLNGNIYPMTSYSFLIDENKKFLGAITDRAQGVFTMQPKSIEILLEHFGMDDGQGAGETCNKRVDNYYRHRFILQRPNCIRCIWNEWQIQGHNQNIRVLDLYELPIQTHQDEPSQSYRNNRRLRVEIQPLEQKKYLLYVENLQETFDGEVGESINIVNLISKQEIISLIRNTFDQKIFNSEEKQNFSIKQAYLTGIPIDEKDSVENDYVLKPMEINAYLLEAEQSQLY